MMAPQICARDMIHCMRGCGWVHATRRIVKRQKYECYSCLRIHAQLREKQTKRSEHSLTHTFPHTLSLSQMHTRHHSCIYDQSMQGRYLVQSRTCHTCTSWERAYEEPPEPQRPTTWRFGEQKPAARLTGADAALTQNYQGHLQLTRALLRPISPVGAW